MICNGCPRGCPALPRVFTTEGIEQPIEEEITMADGVFVRQLRISKAGTFLPQHSHVYDHTTMVAVGAVRAWQNDVFLGEFVAPMPIFIKAGIRHHFVTLADDTTLYCIHNTARAGMVEVIEEGFLPVPAPESMPDAAGMVIAEEAWPQFWRDGQALFAEHAAVVGGDRDGVPLDINTVLVDRLHAAGATHIVTARSNGRMFGYLCTVVGPSIENAGHLVGTTSAFFVSPDAPGLGLKLLRTTVDALRAKGVGEVIMRAGVRGAGPRLGALYRRLGAKPHGELYSLMLKAA